MSIRRRLRVVVLGSVWRMFPQRHHSIVSTDNFDVSSWRMAADTQATKQPKGIFHTEYGDNVLFFVYLNSVHYQSP
jgi:hypothetical protein